MKPADQLSDFVKTALRSGKSRDDIAAALLEAGWAPKETSRALDEWSDSSFNIPVPRPRAYVSTAEAFAYGLMFVALAVCVFNIVIIGVQLVDIWLVQDEQAYRDQYRYDAIRWSVSILVPFAPLFLWMDRRTAASTRSDPSQRRSAVRRWFATVTLFLSIIALLIDAAIAIEAFLSGEATLALVLKLLIVATIAAAVLLYFRKDAADPEAR